MKREVTEFEYFNYNVGQPYNLVVSLRIKGKLTIELLRETFRKLQQRHPLLTVRIDKKGKDIPWLTSEGVGEIPIEIIPRSSDSLTGKEFHDHLVTPFNLEKKELPLFRAAWLTAEQNSDLILCCQHTITDGMSMGYLVRDLIEYLNDPGKEVEVLDTPAKEEDILPPKIRRSFNTKPFAVKIYLAYLKMYHFFVFGKKKKIPPESEDTSHEDLQVHSWSFTKEQTKEFLFKCKSRKISVHTALCTAFLPDISGINTFVDLRKRLNYPIGESFGLFVGGVLLKAKYNKRKNFWQNCHRYQRKLIWNLRDRKIYKVYRLINKSLPRPLLYEFGRLFFDFSSKQIPFAITNLRSLDKLGITFDSNKFSVDSFNAAVSNNFDAMTVLVFTIREKMHFHFHYIDSVHDSKWVRQTSENVTRRLIQS